MLGCSLTWKKRSTILVGRAVGSVSSSVGNATLLVAAAISRTAPVWPAGNEAGAKLLATAQPAALTPAKKGAGYEQAEPECRTKVVGALHIFELMSYG